MPFPSVRIIGGGLAGIEAAYGLANAGVHVNLYEMRPYKMTPAHKTDMLAELVCSNSFKGTDPLSAHGVLKREMESLGSLVLTVAKMTSVPAGKAMAVDRTAFASMITKHIKNHNNITLWREEITDIDKNTLSIVATGPLTSDSLAKELASITGAERLFFYDAVSPIIDAESIDLSHAFFGSRWTDDSDDYLNCPMDEYCYHKFIDELLKADKVKAHEFEDEKFFEGCLPIEVMASRGIDALRYGPMRPVGFRDPATGKRPYALVQLRKENMKGNAYNIVGFQTRLKYPEQKRILGIIPALSSANFLRYGSIHRNTYMDSPKILEQDLRIKECDSIYLAGQIMGVEGYMESAAAGIMAGLSVLARLKGRQFSLPESDTAIGALLRHITDRSIQKFQPMNINFGIMAMPDVRKNKRAEARSMAAKNSFDAWISTTNWKP